MLRASECHHTLPPPLHRERYRPGQLTAKLWPSRIRKVKCDETKPFCLRCTKTGRKCDGYLDPALPKKRHPKNTSPYDHVLGPLLEISAPDEKRAFYFFQHVTAPCVSGDFDAVFWRVTVLQICQAEPAVRHAVLAVSSLHEGLGAGDILPFTDGRPTQPAQSFALQQYNKAIARLLDQMNNPLTRPLASLLTCVLFVCIEYMQGKDKESLIHLEQGRQLLTRLDQRSSDPEMECIVRHIVPLYTRLSLTSFLFGGSPVPIPDALKQQREIPDTFDSIDNMRHCMHEFMEQAFRFTSRARPAKNSSDSIPRETMRLLEVEQDRLLARHAKLDVAFSLFRASTAKPMQTHLHTLLVLQMYLHAQHIWISTALSSSEVVYDDFLSSFAAIVPLAAAYLDGEHAHPPTAAFPPPHRTVAPLLPPSAFASAAAEQPSSRYLPGAAEQQQLSVAYTSHFSFETHIIPPLYYVATKCRHPLIRRSALDLLRRNPFRRENLWRASVMGALAGHIVSLEERWAEGQQGLSSAMVSAPPSSSSSSSLTLLSSSRGGTSHHGTPSGQMQPLSAPRATHAQAQAQPCDPRGDFGSSPYRRGPAEAEPKQLVAAAASGSMSMSTSCGVTPPALRSFDVDVDVPLEVAPPMDPSLLMDAAEVSSSLSHAPSLTASIDDGYSSGGCSLADPAMGFLGAPPSHSEAWVWQQQQQQPSSQQTYSSPVLYERVHAQSSHHLNHLGSLTDHHHHHHHQQQQQAQVGVPMAEYSPYSTSSSDASSVDAEAEAEAEEQQQGYQMTMARACNNHVLLQHHQQQHPHYHHQQSQRTTATHRDVSSSKNNNSTSVPNALVTEAPFGLPEELRVHDAIIGPEREDGSWVAVFRKLHGVDAEWDVQHDWVATV